MHPEGCIVEGIGLGGSVALCLEMQSAISGSFSNDVQFILFHLAEDSVSQPGKTIDHLGAFKNTYAYVIPLNKQIRVSGSVV